MKKLNLSAPQRDILSKVLNWGYYPVAYINKGTKDALIRKGLCMESMWEESKGTSRLKGLPFKVLVVANPIENPLAEQWIVSYFLQNG